MRIDPENIQMADAIEDERFEKDVLLLENDLDALGWDQPPRLYAVMGEPGDYRIELITEMQGHPVDWIKMAVCGVPGQRAQYPGGRLNDDVQGICLAVEGWRHPIAKDIEKTDPEVWNALVEMAHVVGITDEEQIAKHVNNALATLFENHAPSSNPKRVEIRSIVVLMRDGRGISVLRDRGGEPSANISSKEGRLVAAMQAMFTGCWPKDEDMNTPTPDRG